MVPPVFIYSRRVLTLSLVRSDWEERMGEKRLVNGLQVLLRRLPIPNRQ
jgi:hypothetical protein